VAAGAYIMPVLAVVQVASQPVEVRCYRTRQMAVNRVIGRADGGLGALPLRRADVQEHHQIHEE